MHIYISPPFTDFIIIVFISILATNQVIRRDLVCPTLPTKQNICLLDSYWIQQDSSKLWQIPGCWTEVPAHGIYLKIIIIRNYLKKTSKTLQILNIQIYR